MNILFVKPLDQRGRYRFVRQPLDAVGIRTEIFAERRNALISYWKGVRYARQQQGFDAVVITGGDLRDAVWVLLFSFLTRAKVVMRFGGDPFTVRASWIQSITGIEKVIRGISWFFGSRILSLAMKRLDGLIVVTGSLGAVLSKRVGPNTRIHIAPPLSEDIEQPLLNLRKGRSEYFVSILSVANLNYPAKAGGIIFCAVALAELFSKKFPEMTAEYNIIGGGTALQKVQDAVSSLHPSDNFQINIRGFCSEVSEFYQNADIFVYQSTLDAYPLVFIEAKGHGLPIVLNNWEPFGQLVKDNREGKFYETNDQISFQEALMPLLVDKHLRHQIGVNARQVYERAYSAKHIGRGLKQFLEKICR